MRQQACRLALVREPGELVERARETSPPLHGFLMSDGCIDARVVCAEFAERLGPGLGVQQAGCDQRFDTRLEMELELFGNVLADRPGCPRRKSKQSPDAGALPVDAHGSTILNTAAA
jgi:hypothetical protein